MSKHLDRRSFLKGSVVASAGATWGAGREERILLARLAEGDKEPPAEAAAPSPEGMPAGKIGNVEFSRLICGGNLIGGWAHSRDLLYVSKLFKAYNTDEKIMETLQLCEAHGVNTILTNPISGGVINRYWRERGGAIQWIVEAHPTEKDHKHGIQECIDNGAVAMYIQGAVGDRRVKNGQLDVIAKAIEFIKENGLPAGVGAHSLDVVVACEQAGINADFYVKTLHQSGYWSARRPEQTEDVISNRADNYWSISPEKTIEFMRSVEKPWIAFKVLAAGAIPLREGLQYVFGNGADFVCLGMFDFQIAEDAAMAKKVLAETKRDRPWRA